ncbi:MerR family transcriptional regulator [Streptomyces parvus]|uniref:Cobalamin B12-binding domain-containing protein n=1 Tax=Streptomyces parvus TaxID=66428 RepID=A0A5D4JLT6_9ACTN|nr:MerR family transcriptional regulator [Streptomyces parvus]TYR65295.1 cobalamin B12-binding domain-containing protein [Streptomyces parvus]
MDAPGEVSDEREPRGGGLTTGEVARRLGVAPTTIRTWDRRYGIGPARHVGGRHRRWAASDVSLLERMCALTATGIPPAEAALQVRTELRSQDVTDLGELPPRFGVPSRAGSGLRLGAVRQECRGVARAALRLDAAALDHLLESAIAKYGIVSAWVEVMMPTLQAVGRKWESSGERYIEVEHFLSWHVSGALRRCTRPTEVRPGGVTVIACVPGDGHTLPLEALAAALSERGLEVRMFGPSLPAESLIAAVRRTGPAAVALWSQSRTTASPPLARHVSEMEWGVRGARRGPTVLTLGPGWMGQKVPGLLHPPGLVEAVAATEAIVQRQAVAERTDRGLR